MSCRMSQDWWNSRTISVYWKNWNLPVHQWMLRHLCKHFPRHSINLYCPPLSLTKHAYIVDIRLSAGECACPEAHRDHRGVPVLGPPA